MIQAISKTMTLDEFLDWYPDGYGSFELYNGVIVEMQPTGTRVMMGQRMGQRMG